MLPYIVYTNFGSLETGRAAGSYDVMASRGIGFILCLNVRRNFFVCDEPIKIENED